MTLQFSKYKNSKITDFKDKICKGLLENNQQFYGEYTTIPEYLALRKDYEFLPGKIHTVREKTKFEIGTNIHFKQWEGRPFHSNNINFAPLTTVKSIQDIEIYNLKSFTDKGMYALYNQIQKEYFTQLNGNYSDELIIIVDRLLLVSEKLNQFIKNDGFNSISEFQEWFNSRYFKGKLIHWTGLSY